MFDRFEIRSLLETDFYKFTMGQLVYQNFPWLPTEFRLINRTTDIKLEEWLSGNELRRQLDRVAGISFSVDEIDYLSTAGLVIGDDGIEPGFFSPQYLDFLRNFRMPSFSVREEGGQYIIYAHGEWARSTYWEIPVLKIITSMFMHEQRDRLGFSEQDVWNAGERRLVEKIRILKKYPWIRFVDFGTRRTWSAAWHEHVLEVLLNEIPDQVAGTSNVFFARKFDIEPTGTMAHELFMVYAGHYGKTDNDEGLRASQRAVLTDWEILYGDRLLLALSDTFGSNAFLEDFRDFAERWDGTRQDSGDPIAFGDKMIAFYETIGIDPRDKIVVFSDGLDVRAIVRIAEHFRGRIRFSFGWGTNLTNDMGDQFRTLSLVMKAHSVSGRLVGKLSDNPFKATGPKEVIERYQRVFDYDPEDYQYESSDY